MQWNFVCIFWKMQNKKCKQDHDKTNNKWERKMWETLTHDLKTVINLSLSRMRGKKTIGWRLIISGCKVKGTSIVNKMPDLLRYTLHQTPTTSKGWNRVFDIWKINPIYLISLLLQVIIRPDIIWLEDIIFPFPIPQTEKKVAQITSQDNN